MPNKYGWIPDLPDHRDHKFQIDSLVIYPSIDLRPSLPAPYDQGDLGSCTANAIAGAIQFDQAAQKLPIIMPSRLLIYYDERLLEGTVTSDAGAMIRDGIKTVNARGACPESEWPYIISKFADAPSAACYKDALLQRALSYQSIKQDTHSMKACLSGRHPFVFGFSVYDSFESVAVAKTGLVPMPGVDESLLGGHAVLACGYNDTNSTVNGIPPQHIVARNSWGPDWGDKGYFYMPYAYLTNRDLADDMWAIKVIS